MQDLSPQETAALARAYSKVFSGPEGKLVLEDLARRCFFTTTTFVAGDPAASSIREGMRVTFCWIVGMLGLSRVDLTKLIEDGIRDDFGDSNSIGRTGGID